MASPTTPPDRHDRGRNLAVASAASVAVGLVIILIGLGIWLRSPTVTGRLVALGRPTTSAAAGTAPTAVRVDPNVTTVATAKVAAVDVSENPPADLVADPAATAAGAELRSLTAPYSAERPGAATIPAIGAPVRGRIRTTSGWSFDNPTPFGGQLTFVVTENHGAWLRVLMPVRPNGTQGWIRSSDVSLSTVTTRIEVTLGDRRLRAWDGVTLVADTHVVIGSADRPTPLGRLYVTDAEKKYRGSAYGPWVLALSGYSQQLDSFSGGVPVIALHGTNRPSLIGTAASNGCIRMPDDVIDLLHSRIPYGTPVDIRA